jgi:hypothetical protein
VALAPLQQVLVQALAVQALVEVLAVLLQAQVGSLALALVQAVH